MQLLGLTNSSQRVATDHSSRQEEYMERISKGDKSALSALYEETKASVYGFALSILRNEYDAEDVLQDTYVRVWTSAGDYRPMGKPMAWVLTITRNLATSILRERMKISDFPEDEIQPREFTESPAASVGDRIVLRAAMDRLSEGERQIFILHALTGLKHVEIAKIVSMPLSTVLSKYNRAKKKLQNYLEEGKTYEK